MIDIFASLHDIHTGCLRSRSGARWPFFLQGPASSARSKYLVSNVRTGFSHTTFDKGVEVLSWNGVPIARAVEAAGARSGGSNSAAQHAKGLARLTTRALVKMSPPDEEWVTVGYCDRAGREYETRFDWVVIEKSKLITIEPSTMSLEVDLLRQVRKPVRAAGGRPDTMDVGVVAAEANKPTMARSGI
jgi:hypothetical protein